jgi:hypothetical protein
MATSKIFKGLTKGIKAKASTALQKKRLQRALRPKASTEQNIQMHGASTKARQQAKIQEAQKGAKKAERGSKTKQVEKRVLPDVSRIRARLKGLTATQIADKYTGLEITSMMRKIKHPQVLAKLQRAKRMRTKQGKSFIEQNPGVRAPGYTPVPRAGSRGAELGAKTFKKGGVAKRKSGGKMNTDGNSFVAALYKGGKVGG